MANVNIPDLTALTAPAAADVIEVYDDSASENKKLALSYVALLAGANVFTAVNSFDGGTVGSGSGDATTVLVAKTEANASDTGRGPAIAFRNFSGYPLRGGRIAVVSRNHYASNVAMTFSVDGETSSEERMRLDGSGHLLVNTTTDSGQLTVNGELAIVDGMTAPSTTSGWAKIYVDSADGDLKIKFGDGTVKTIVVDT